MGWKEKSYTFKGFLIGLILSIIYWLIRFVLIIVDEGFFASPDPIGEKVFGFLIGILGSILITAPIWIIILLVFTIIGWILGRIKSKSTPQ